ncbi:MAG: MarR family transcriptional regulator [Terracidiphilus sp.]
MNANQAKALLRLIDEIPALFHLLRAVAGDVHGHDVSSAGRRGVLRSLDREGPQTVPQMARARNVSRQHIQVLINGLLEDGLVACLENPAHRRSLLVRLTAKGKRRLAAAGERELRLLARARLRLSSKEIDSAADALRSLRDLLQSKEWSDYAAASN